MNLTFERFTKPEDYGWHWGADDLFKFRIQARQFSVSWDRVPVSNLLRDLRRQIEALHRELTNPEKAPGSDETRD